MEFIYNVLSAERREIRLLTLESASADSSRICCSLATFPVDQTPDFEALSYEWGDDPSRKTIKLCGKPHAVTLNLHAALLQLRSRDSPRLMWIDALCINQKDVVERTLQVRMMGTIYKSASLVLAWLGDGDHSYELEGLLDLGGDADRHLLQSLEPHVHANSVNPSLIINLSNFLRHGWWSRIWMVQETILASRLTFVCGTVTFDFSVLEQLSHNVASHLQVAGCCGELLEGSESHYYQWLVLALSQIQQLAWFRLKYQEKKSLDLLQLTMFFRTRHAKDLRDKIFGMAGLTETEPDELIDYNVPLHQSYINSTVNFIQQDGNLDVFNYLDTPKPSSTIELATGKYITDRLRSLPSWVPDWTQTFEGQSRNHELLQRRCHWLTLYNSAGDRKAKIKLLPSNELVVEGVLFDKIKAIRSIEYFMWNPAAKLAGFKDMAGLANSYLEEYKRPSKFYPSGCTIHEAFRQTICSNYSILNSNSMVSQDPVAIKAESEFDSFLFAEWACVDICESPRGLIIPLDLYAAHQEIFDSITLEHRQVFSRIIGASLHRRRFVITEKGYMGLAPFGVKKGDVVSVLSGGKTPYILRNSSTEGYVMIGSSYVHGLMDGQIYGLIDSPQSSHGEADPDILSMGDILLSAEDPPHEDHKNLFQNTPSEDGISVTGEEDIDERNGAITDSFKVDTSFNDALNSILNQSQPRSVPPQETGSRMKRLLRRLKSKIGNK